MGWICANGRLQVLPRLLLTREYGVYQLTLEPIPPPPAQPRLNVIMNIKANFESKQENGSMKAALAWRVCCLPVDSDILRVREAAC